MRLFVDDVRAAPHGWVTVRTAEDAIRMLATFDVEEVSLDHDAGRKDTFQPVAYYIAARFGGCPIVDIPKVTIHSNNYPGSRTMKAILETAGVMSEHAPFLNS